MPIYNSAELKNIARSRTLQESRLLEAQRGRSLGPFDIFLSHSYLEKEEVEGLYLELTRLGYRVYVDWIVDPHLDRSHITWATVNLIRNRMKASRALLLAISVQSRASKWMPWELGFMDGYSGRCAIVPVHQTSHNVPRHYAGFEFLSLYPFIRKVPLKRGGESLFAIGGAYSYVIFREWLDGSALQREDINIYEID